MRTPSRDDRRGTVLVMVVACLVVASMMLVAVARQAALARRSAQAGQRSLQAQWLAEAGVERAVARWAADPAYAGETWRIAAGELDSLDDAEVRIMLQPVAGRPGRSSIRVEADYPRAAELRFRSTKQIEVDRERITPPVPTNAP